ncbi:MAG: hypothetical protein M3Z15_04225 [Pseudomonadota bacterium]|nr:hypothetical protein [Pseudomonadota bacterium]
MQTCARRPGVRGAPAALVVATATLACSPVFDWREARPEGSGATLMFPCRPVKEERSVRIGAAVLPMSLHSCRADGAVFLLATVEVADPAAVTPLLAAFRSQAIANLAGVASGESAFSPAGATPNPQSARIAIAGARRDGQAVGAQAAFFVKGLRLYQATVLGAEGASGREAVETFFGAIRLP